MSESLQVTGAIVRICALEISRKDVADYLERMPEDAREIAFVEAVEVGVFCLERCRSSQDVEFVRRQMDAVLIAVSQIPAAVEKELVGRIGGADGQVLAPVLQAVRTTSALMGERVQDVRKLLAVDLDPGKRTSVLGSALTEIKAMVDPKRSDSIQGSLHAAITSVTAPDGTLVQVIKTVVCEAVKPLADEMDRLGKDIRGREAAEEVIQQTTQKGFSYQDLVVAEVQHWAVTAGAEVSFVGDDNRPGDILVEVKPLSLASAAVWIVIEVRDRQGPVGRKVIADHLATAMARRDANAAIYLSHTRDGLALEIGDWGEGHCELGPWVATTGEHLVSALRLLVVLRRLEEIREAGAEVDLKKVEAQVQRVRTALGHIRNINRKVTDVRAGADYIQTEAEALRDEIRSALCAIEDAIGLPPPGGLDDTEATAA